MKKIVKSYADLDTLDLDSKKKGYQRVRNKVYQQNILKLLPEGVSVWIDSNGVDISPNIIAFENFNNKDIFKPKSVNYYKNTFSKTLYQYINKYIKPVSLVFYQSEEFRYITDDKVIENINFLSKLISCKIIVYIDIVFIDFNKLKYPINNIIAKIKKNINLKCKVHNLDNFKYIFEIQ